MRPLVLAALALTACAPEGQPSNAGDPAMVTPTPSPAGGRRAAERIGEERRAR